MKFIKENWFKLGFLIFLALFVSTLFYWYELRPSKIRKQCYQQTYARALNLSPFGKEAIEEQGKELDYEYQKCLLRDGEPLPLKFGF